MESTIQIMRTYFVLLCIKPICLALKQQSETQQSETQQSETQQS